MNVHKLTVLLSLFACISLTILSPGCSSNVQITEMPHSVAVSFNGVFMKELTQAELETLPRVSVVLGKDTRTGPTLLSVLQLAGVGEFAALTVSGYSSRGTDVTQILNKKTDMNENMILYYFGQGTTGRIGVWGSTILDKNRTMDVTSLDASPFESWYFNP